MNATKGLSVADNRGVLPMIISETGADDEPEIERIICVAISGGADYLNGMPRELTLERITPQESIFARYIQTDQGTRWGRPTTPPAPLEGEARRLVEWLNAEADLRRNVLSAPTGLNLAQAARQADKLQSWANLIEAQAAAPPAPLEGEGPTEEPGVDDVLKLAAIIREVDGSHRLGAAALAEAILARWGRPAHALPLPAPQGGEGGVR